MGDGRFLMRQAVDEEMTSIARRFAEVLSLFSAKDRFQLQSEFAQKTLSALDAIDGDANGAAEQFK
jgi:hypothetical protein